MNKYDKTGVGWILREDVAFDGKPFIPNIIEFLKLDEPYVNGEVMKQRAMRLGACLGQHHAKYLLEHQALISKEWREYKLVFPGTVWRDKRGRRRFAYLHWNGERWSLHFPWFGHSWSSTARLVGYKQ